MLYNPIFSVSSRDHGRLLTSDLATSKGNPPEPPEHTVWCVVRGPNMAAHRIRATTTNNTSLPRCKSEGTLIDLSEGVSEASLTDVKGQLLQL